MAVVGSWTDTNSYSKDVMDETSDGQVNNQRKYCTDEQESHNAIITWRVIQSARRALFPHTTIRRLGICAYSMNNS